MSQVKRKLSFTNIAGHLKFAYKKCTLPKAVDVECPTDCKHDVHCDFEHYYCCDCRIIWDRNDK